jgi:S-adenosylmethionine:tRNA ribosyltransferase-isomerase
LPAELIAQHPRPRGTSRLLTLDRRAGTVAHRSFSELPQLLRAGDLLVRNDVRVRATRLYGRDEQRRLVEVFLLRPLDGGRRRWLSLAKPGRRAKPGGSLAFGDITATVANVDDEARRIVEFDTPITDEILNAIGHVPLPPYIRREPGAPDSAEDRERYQTVYARDPLAVAAPTAGLHFTDEILGSVASRGVEIADLTLAVGAGTFKPVAAHEIERHSLDSEEVHVPAPTAARVERARSEKRRIVAVGVGSTQRFGGTVCDRSLHHAGVRVPRRRRAHHQLPSPPLDAADARLRVCRPGQRSGRIRRGDSRAVPLLLVRRRDVGWLIQSLSNGRGVRRRRSAAAADDTGAEGEPVARMIRVGSG